MSRKCWAFPFTPCTAGGTRATAQLATEWAVTCGTGVRPLRLGWSSRPTSASKPGARSVPSGPRSIGPGAGQSGLEEVFEHLGRSGRALLAAHVAVGREGEVVRSHIQKRADRRYRARWLDPDGRERSRTFTRKADAERYLAALEGAKLSGAYVNDANPVTVGEYARKWAANRPHRRTTATRVESLISKHIEGTTIGAKRLSAVRASEIQAWVTDRAKVLSPTTVRLLVQTLRSVFNAAVQDRLIASSPVARLSLPRSENARIVPLTVAQVQALADAMPDHCRAMIIIQAGLGLRIAELLALRLEDVDFLRRTVRVEWQLTQDGKHRVSPKTPRSRRTVPLPTVVAETLASHISEFSPAEDGSLFTTSSGNLYRQEHFGDRVFKPAAKSAGLPAGVTSHDLRHHYASVLLSAGESVVAVAERLGHENATLVLRTYGHLMPDSEDRTRRAIDTAWSTSDGLETAQAPIR